MMMMMPFFKFFLVMIMVKGFNIPADVQSETFPSSCPDIQKVDYRLN